MASKWKRRCELAREEIKWLRQQIDGLMAYQRTLQQHLEIAKRDMQQAVAWAERSEKEAERLKRLADEDYRTGASWDAHVAGEADA